MKVAPFKIPKRVHESLVAQIDESPVFYDKLHQHEEFQISGIVRGSGKLIVADSIHHYTSGDIVVIGGQCPHVFRSIPATDTSRMISLFFTRTSFGESFFDLPEMEQLQSFFKRADAGFLILSNKAVIMRLLARISRSYGMARFISFMKLLLKIEQSDSRVLTGFIYPRKLTLHEGNRMQRVFDYVMGNFQQDISLKTMGGVANMSTGAFCRFFKQRTNKTFFQFLIELRIEHACHLLARNSEMAISEIAELSGFRSISNFNRKFRSSKGRTPSEYFRSMQLPANP